MISSKHLRPGSISEILWRIPLKFRSAQKLYHRLYKNPAPSLSVFAGSAWFSIHKDLLDAIIESSTERLISEFEHCFYPDELYFQSLALSFDKFRIVNSDFEVYSLG